VSNLGQVCSLSIAPVHSAAPMRQWCLFVCSCYYYRWRKQPRIRAARTTVGPASCPRCPTHPLVVRWTLPGWGSGSTRRVPSSATVSSNTCRSQTFVSWWQPCHVFPMGHHHPTLLHTYIVYTHTIKL